MTTNLRVRWPFLVAAALSAAALVLFHLWPLGGEDAASAASYPTAAQNAAAARLVSSLPVPPGTTRDPYATACGVTSHYCVTSASLSARDLVAQVRDLLASRGATVRKPMSCDQDPNPRYRKGGCGALLSFDGTDLVVTANDATVVGGIRRPAFADVATESDMDSAPVTAALGSWRGLRLLPPSWGAPRCITPVAGDCRAYEGDLTIRLPLARVVTLIESHLTSAGLVANTLPCESDRCFVFGKKYRGLDGTDPIDVTVMLSSATAGTTTARLTVSDH
jgi:hypothetical protein